jgi:hypothetical protein
VAIKKGFVFTMDVLIGLGLILIIFIFAFLEFGTILPEKKYQKLNFIAEDIMNLLVYLQVKDIKDKPTVNQLINDGTITEKDMDKSVLDIIAGFWYKNNKTIAENITKETLGNITDAVNLKLSIDGQDIYSSSSSTTSAKEVAVASRIESGYEPGKPSYGYIARAFLTKIRGKKDSSYVYFGGYVGDGNISTHITLPPFDNVLEAYMELDTGSNFNLYINGNYSGNYSNGTAGGGFMRSDKWVVCNTTYKPYYCSNFTAGNNILNFNFTGNGLFIGGGYFRVTYNTSQISSEEEVGKDIYWFPGISGFFNLYDSFYVPGTLTSMTSHLHYFNNITLDQTNATVYLSIGNNKIFRSNKTGEQIVILSYDNISQIFGSQQNLIGNVSNRTVPLRFGVEGFQAQGGGVGTADAVLITDVSGSMSSNCDVESPPPSNIAPDCNLGKVGVQNYRIDVAKNVSKVFVDTVLGTSGDRVGLVSYESTLSNTHPLSNNSNTLKGNITAYSAGGSTCMSCGISSATQMLNAVLESRFKGMVVMSDGYANQCLNGNDCGIYGGPVSGSATSLDPNYPAKLEALNKSCEARNKNYTVFSVGFGSGADNITLQRIACWNCSACQIVLNCNQFSTQSSCQSHPECSWNSTVFVNNTIFYDNFESWSTSNDCSFNPSNLWNSCLDTSNSRIRGSNTRANGSLALTTNRWNGQFPNSEALIKCVDLSSYSKAYLTFWWRKNNLAAGEYGNISINTSSSSWVTLWSSGTGSTSNFAENQINITNYISSRTCIGISEKSSTSDSSKWVNYDDLRIIGTSNGICENNFSSSSPCWIGNVTLPDGTTAKCLDVRYAQSNNVDELKKIYGTFGQMFAILGYTTQKANITGNVNFNNILYPDSRIEFQYSPVIIPYQYGEISLTKEAPRLKDLTGDNISIPYKEGWFNNPDQVKVVDAKITSYSSEYWTDMLWINSSATGGWNSVYNLTYYGNDYTILGDPFIIHIPIDKISSGNNSVRIETGVSPVNKTGGSPDDKVIYTIRIRGSVPYGDVFNISEDATEDANWRLNNSLQGYVDFNPGDIMIENNTLRGIQWLWGPSSLKVVVSEN